MAGTPSLIANAADIVRDRLRRVLPWAYGFTTKHDYAKDYGWPENLGFQQFHRMYCRSSIAAAAVDKTIGKTWQTMPALWESEKPGNTPAEQAIAQHFTRKKIWRGLMEADRRSMVGSYAGAIIRLRDDKKPDQPVDRVPGGIEAIAAIVPAWEGQLSVAEWDQDRFSDTYGEPLIYQFNEQAVGDASLTAVRTTVRVHRDRVLIWSDDGTLNCRSALEPGFNDVADAEKIKGAGGEGFWKTARGAPIITSPQGMTYQDIAKAMGGGTPEETKAKLDAKLDDFQSGFDKGLMLGGMDAKPMQITLPQPKEFWEPCVQSFAASMGIPFKVLIGNVTGERASTEDAEEWGETNMSRRENRVLPILHDFIDRLVAWGVLDKKDWTIGWASLTDATPDQQLDRAAKMGEINKNTLPGDVPPFMPDEIREAAGFDTDVEGWDDPARGGEDQHSETGGPEPGPAEGEA